MIVLRGQPYTVLPDGQVRNVRLANGKRTSFRMRQGESHRQFQERISEADAEAAKAPTASDHQPIRSASPPQPPQPARRLAARPALPSGTFDPIRSSSPIAPKPVRQSGKSVRSPASSQDAMLAPKRPASEAGSEACSHASGSRDAVRSPDRPARALTTATRSFADALKTPLRPAESFERTRVCESLCRWCLQLKCLPVHGTSEDACSARVRPQRFDWERYAALQPHLGRATTRASSGQRAEVKPRGRSQTDLTPEQQRAYDAAYHRWYARETGRLAKEAAGRREQFVDCLLQPLAASAASGEFSDVEMLLLEFAWQSLVLYSTVINTSAVLYK